MAVVKRPKMAVELLLLAGRQGAPQRSRMLAQTIHDGLPALAARLRLRTSLSDEANDFAELSGHLVGGEDRVGIAARVALRQEPSPRNDGDLPRIAALSHLQQPVDDAQSASEQDRMRS